MSAALGDAIAQMLAAKRFRTKACRVATLPIDLIRVSAAQCTMPFSVQLHTNITYGKQATRVAGKSDQVAESSDQVYASDTVAEASDTVAGNSDQVLMQATQSLRQATQSLGRATKSLSQTEASDNNQSR